MPTAKFGNACLVVCICLGGAGARPPAPEMRRHAGHRPHWEVVTAYATGNYEVALQLLSRVDDRRTFARRYLREAEAWALASSSELQPQRHQVAAVVALELIHLTLKDF